MDFPCGDDQLSFALDELEKDKIIFNINNFYSLKNDELLIKKRQKENTDALKQLKTAKRVTAFLTWFPFVKGVAISGSLSKNIANENSDFDFFMITKANRLWVAKIFFACLIKCASLIGLRKWFCLNYIVDETYLEVKEKNTFTATEIATLMPVRGAKIFDDFFSVNAWVYDFFPNLQTIPNAAKEYSPPLPRRFIEWLLKNKTGEKADNVFMHYFSRRWKRLMGKKKFTQTGFQLGAMMVDKHSCRPYPHHFQQKILTLYTEKTENILKTRDLIPVLR